MTETEEKKTANATVEPLNAFFIGCAEDSNKAKVITLQYETDEESEDAFIAISEDGLRAIIQAARISGLNLDGGQRSPNEQPLPATRLSRNAGMTWDKGEEALLLHLYEIGTGSQEMSACLGRPNAELVTKLIKLGVGAGDPSSALDDSEVPW